MSGDLHFFHYPVKHRERCNQWIKNAKRPEFFDLPDDQLRNKVICDLHFEPRYFTNELRKRLVHNAVPTVNVGCEEEVLHENNLEYKDVQILPANEEGTIFTVDTDSLQQKDNTPISTYSFRNGALVPVYSFEEQTETEQVLYTIDEDDLKPVSYRDSNTNDYLFVDSNRSEELQESYEIVFNGNSENSQASLERKPQTVGQYPRRNYSSNQQQNVSQERMEVVYLHEEHGQPPVVIKSETDTLVIEPPKPKASKSKAQHASRKPFQNHKPAQVSTPFKRKFMNQMRVHSREIASIKRTLNASLRQTSKFNINKLRGRIAPSLLGALSLNLHNRKSNFTKEEIEFLTKVYKISPEMYNVLIDKLHWNLPEASVVQQLLKK